jgi:lysyl-tRNA synthetase class 2
MSDRLEDIVEFRRKKLERIEQAGMEPYPSTTARTHTNQQALDQFDKLQGKLITLVGRIRGLRVMGKLAFAHIEDGTGRFQILLKADEVGEEKFTFFQENFDIGDFIEATGTLFITKSGEKTLQIASYKILAKSLLPLPSEHYGLEDQETRLRKRYLDILLNPEIKQLFINRNRFWSSMREFMNRNDFMEVEMPVLESVTGGAEAEPFVTHHNALDRDFYLRISLELPLKKLLVAGYEKVYEIGRIFRNEGISTEHLQDYMQMEFYWAYGDFDKLMKFCQDMYQYIIEKTFGTLSITNNGVTVDWSGNWERVDYFKVFKQHTGLDLESVTEDELRKHADSHKITYETFARRGRLIDLIFKKSVRPKLSQGKPFFLINQPLELEPLAKRDPKNPKVVQRMQIIAYGTELGKGFGELNDPIDQRRRFDDQMKLREAGDSEAQMLNEEYVEAMEYGMPPAAGFGVSERLFSMLADKSIREAMIFPPMKDAGVGAAGKEAKAKRTQMAVAVINAGLEMEPWQKLNTVAHLNAAFGARVGRTLLFQDEATTADHKKIKMNIQHAIMLKTGPSSKDLRVLADKARAQGLQVTEFTREMIVTSSDEKVIAITKSKPLAEIDFFGVLVYGDKKTVESLTADFPLYK